MKEALNNETYVKGVTEDIWLNYFNRYLFECGTISEKEYKNNCPIRTMKFSRYNRIATGHVQTVQYIATITI